VPLSLQLRPYLHLRYTATFTAVLFIHSSIHLSMYSMISGSSDFLPFTSSFPSFIILSSYLANCFLPTCYMHAFFTLSFHNCSYRVSQTACYSRHEIDEKDFCVCANCLIHPSEVDQSYSTARLCHPNMRSLRVLRYLSSLSHFPLSLISWPLKTRTGYYMFIPA
jgi:hypothetical protein